MRYRPSERCACPPLDHLVCRLILAKSIFQPGREASRSVSGVAGGGAHLPSNGMAGVDSSIPQQRASASSSVGVEQIHRTRTNHDSRNQFPFAGHRYLLSLEACGIRLWRLGSIPARRSIDRLDGLGAIQVNHGIELAWKMGFEIMAQSLRPGAIDDSDRSLQPGLVQQLTTRSFTPEWQKKVPLPKLVKQCFPTSREGRPHSLVLWGSIPVRCGCYRAFIGAESHEDCVAPEALARKLANVPLAGATHARASRISNMRVVLPHHHLTLTLAPVQVSQQRFECLRHVSVAQVPRRDAPPEHRPIILLGVLDQSRVLFRKKEFVIRDAPVLGRQFAGLALQFEQLLHRMILAG